MADVLLEACYGVLVANATGNERIQVDAINKLLDAARSAATELEALRKRCEAVEADSCKAWKDAVLDALAGTGMDAAHDEPPYSILNRIIRWHTDLDPAPKSHEEG